MKKIPGDIILLHKCTKNHDHMLYCSWDMAHDECNFVIFHFRLIFALLQPEKWKFQKMKKAAGDVTILHKCTKNFDHMVYCSGDMARDRCNGYFSFWAIFCPFTQKPSPKIKISKKWKKRQGI